jgi:hypothetical protein
MRGKEEEEEEADGKGRKRDDKAPISAERIF